MRYVDRAGHRSLPVCNVFTSRAATKVLTITASITTKQVTPSQLNAQQASFDALYVKFMSGIMIWRRSTAMRSELLYPDSYCETQLLAKMTMNWIQGFLPSTALESRGSITLETLAL